MDVSLIDIMRCPACMNVPLRVRRAGRSSRLWCERCGIAINRDGAFLDVATLGPHGDFTPSTLEQSLMQSEPVARLYERIWRPMFVRAVAGKGTSEALDFSGEFFVHKNSLGMEDREGPWLDLSCGTGLFTRAMAAAVPGELVVGVDVSAAMLDVAARRGRGYSNIALLRADAHQLPLRDDRLGGVNNSSALHAYDDPEQVFREVLRVLRPGGVYVGSTFARARRLRSRVAARIAGIRRFETNQLQAWLSRVGFVDYDEVQLGGAFIFRARKP